MSLNIAWGNNKKKFVVVIFGVWIFVLLQQPRQHQELQLGLGQVRHEPARLHQSIQSTEVQAITGLYKAMWFPINAASLSYRAPPVTG